MEDKKMKGLPVCTMIVLTVLSFIVCIIDMVIYKSYSDGVVLIIVLVGVCLFYIWVKNTKNEYIMRCADNEFGSFIGFIASACIGSKLYEYATTGKMKDFEVSLKVVSAIVCVLPILWLFHSVFLFKPDKDSESKKDNQEDN